jgi:hypothetical protein
MVVVSQRISFGLWEDTRSFGRVKVKVVYIGLLKILAYGGGSSGMWRTMPLYPA